MQQTQKFVPYYLFIKNAMNAFLISRWCRAQWWVAGLQSMR